MENKVKLAKLLLEHGARPDIFNEDSKTAIYYASREKLLLNFPTLKGTPIAREKIGNCTIEKKVSAIITSSLKEFGPLYNTNSPRLAIHAKSAYYAKIFQKYKSNVRAK